MAISAGDEAAYALLADGRVEAWGKNFSGQLGIGTISPATGCECLGRCRWGARRRRAIYGGGATASPCRRRGGRQGWGLNDVSQIGNGGASEPGCSAFPRRHR